MVLQAQVVELQKQYEKVVLQVAVRDGEMIRMSDHLDESREEQSADIHFTSLNEVVFAYGRMDRASVQRSARRDC